MKRTIILAGLLVLLLLGVVAYRTATATPDRMWKWQLEAWLSKELGMSGMSLVEQGPGRFTGTATKDGKTYQLRVTREPGQVSWDYTHQGSSGVRESHHGGTSWSP